MDQSNHSDCSDYSSDQSFQSIEPYQPTEPTKSAELKSDQIDRENEEYYNRKNKGKKSKKTTQYPTCCSTDLFFKIERVDNPKENNKYFCSDFDEDMDIYGQIFNERKMNNEIKYDKNEKSNDEIIQLLEKYKKNKTKEFNRRYNETKLSYFLPITHSAWINKANKVSKEDFSESLPEDYEDYRESVKMKFNTIEYKVSYKDSNECFENSFGRYSPEWNWSKDPRPKGSGKRQIKQDMRYEE